MVDTSPTEGIYSWIINQGRSFDKMRSVQLLFVLVFALYATTVTAKLNLDKLRADFFNVTDSKGSLYVQSLRYLQREPPVGKALNRAASPRLSTNTIEQKLDQFDDANEETWQMVKN